MSSQYRTHLLIKTASPLWASYQIRKIAGCACAGNAGNVFPHRRLQRKSLVSYPGLHHGTCVTHVPWCMSGLLTCGVGENVPGIPGACATRNFTYLARGPWRCYLLTGIPMLARRRHHIVSTPCTRYNITKYANVSTSYRNLLYDMLLNPHQFDMII